MVRPAAGSTLALAMEWRLGVFGCVALTRDTPPHAAPGLAARKGTEAAASVGR